jgi:alkylation response protein AidB-like acyl-CoA dehydrogenase
MFSEADGRRETFSALSGGRKCLTRSAAYLKYPSAPSRETGVPAANGSPHPSAPAATRDFFARVEALAERMAERAYEIDRAGAFPEKEFAWIEEADLLAAPLSSRHGGRGLGAERKNTSALLTLLRHLGRGNLSVARLYEGHANALTLIYRFGTPAQKERFAADARAGKRFAVWNTEGSDGVRLASAGEGRYRLSGAKTFASGAGHLERPLITARFADHHPRSGEPQMLVVPADEVETTVDESWWTPVGMRASASYKIDFGGVEVGGEHLIGAPGDYHREPYFSGGAIRFAAAQFGGAEALPALVRRHLQEAGRTGDVHQRRRAGEAALAGESARLILEHAAALFDQYGESKKHAGAERGERSHAAERVVAYAHLARTAVEQTCTGVLQRAERSIGARGMMQPHALERIARDLRVYLRQPAPDAALDALGRHVLEAPGAPLHRLWTDDALPPTDDADDPC